MSKEELLQQYENDVKNLRNCAKSLNLSDEEITQIFKDCFVQLNHENGSSNPLGNNAQKIFYYFTKIFLFFIFIAFIVYILLNVHQPTSSIVLRNVQGLIYPGLKLLRFWSVPIIKKFPTLTGKLRKSDSRFK